MKPILVIPLIVLLNIGCSKSNFDIEHPNVQLFVKQLKEGTYNCYKYREDGVKLWALMPQFSTKNIGELIEMANDTAIITPAGHFPVNPISSIPPYRLDKNNKAGIMIGEYLLWCVEGIIHDISFISLTPHLLNLDKKDEVPLTGKEILEVRKLYLNWLTNFKATGKTGPTPLEGTHYQWR